MSFAGQAIIAIWHDIMDAGRDEFYWWHMHEHMPERVAIPGIVRGRRYIAEEGAPEFFNFYEAETIATLSGRGYLDRLDAPTEWTRSTVKYFTNVARSLQQVRYTAGPGMGGYLLVYNFDISQAEPGGEEFSKRMAAEILAGISEEKGICGVHLNETRFDISDKPTKERALRSGGTGMPGWSLMIEAARRDDLDRVRKTYLGDDVFRPLGVEGTIGFGLYRLEYVRTKSDQPV